MARVRPSFRPMRAQLPSWMRPESAWRPMILRAPLNNSQCAKDNPCGAATITLWKEACDRLVYQRREAAGAAFIAASKQTDKGERVKAYTAVQADLQALQTQYPDSRYKDGVAASLATVAAAIR